MPDSADKRIEIVHLGTGLRKIYASPKELLHHPATEFVGRLVEQERRLCHLPGDRLEECEYSGAGAK